MGFQKTIAGSIQIFVFQIGLVRKSDGVNQKVESPPLLIHFLKEWADYFPHVDEAQLRGNYHKKLDALQGKRRTVMVGEVFNLPLVSECVDWARYVVRREFPRVAEASA